MEPRRRFRVLKEISEGAFGKVYLAEMITGENFKSVVAIKLLHGKWKDHEEIVKRSRDEARVLGLLHHRNIIRVEDLTSINGQCAIVMEYLDGVDVKTLINYCREHDLRLPRKVALDVTAQIATALDAAYGRTPLAGGDPLRLIHRDIKPSNVMVTVAGDVKVLDFGTAQAHFDDREAHTQALAFGSAAYMAPERLLGDPDAPSGDVFSLGVTLYEMLAYKGYGKIHIRPEKYTGSLHKRVDAIDLTDLPAERAEQVRTTLKLILSYDADERPSAAQVVDLMEALSEEIHDGSMRRFCREVVQPCRASVKTPQNPADPLTGSTLFEDHSILSGPQDHDPRLTWIDEGDGAEIEGFEIPEPDSPFVVPPELLADPTVPEPQYAEPPPVHGPSVSQLEEAAEDENSGDAIGPVVELAPPPVSARSISEMFSDDGSEELPARGHDVTMPVEPPFAPEPFVDDEITDVPLRVEGLPPAVEPEAPPPAAADRGGIRPEPVSEKVIKPVAIEIKPDEPDAAAPRRGGGMLKFVLLGGVLLALVGVVGVVLVVIGGLDLLGRAGQTPAPDDGPVAQGDPLPADLVRGGTITVHEPGADTGDVTLKLAVGDVRFVSVFTSVDEFKTDWDGSGELVLKGARAGLYRANIDRSSGSKIRTTLDVVAGQSCTYTFDNPSDRQWKKVSCE